MRSRSLVSVLALALTGATLSCGDDILGIDRNFEENATWTATLSPANEVPATNSTATGRAWFIDRGSTIDWRLEYSGLVANASGAHVHRGAAGVNGGIVIPLTFVAQRSGVAIGTIDMTLADVSSSEAGVQSAADIRALLSSGGYVNVHSNSGTTPQTGFPGGEIRGQVAPR
jgi:hypothetical protein